MGIAATELHPTGVAITAADAARHSSAGSRARSHLMITRPLDSECGDDTWRAAVQAGYNAGRTIALHTGSVASGHRWPAEHRNADNAFIAGYEWSLWDYDDSKGLAHESRPRPTAG